MKIEHHQLFDDTGTKWVSKKEYSGLFVVKTPALDDSGVSHGVEHFVFRCSAQFPQPESLFQLTALTDLTINASTQHDLTYYHCHSSCQQTFLLGLHYLWCGLTQPQILTPDFRQEIYAEGGYGVIYRELLTQPSIAQGYQYGGTAALISQLTMADLRHYHQRYYRADNMVLVTNNTQSLPWSRSVTTNPPRDFNSSSVHGKFSSQIGHLIAYYQGLVGGTKQELRVEKIEPLIVTQALTNQPKALDYTPNTVIQQLEQFDMSSSDYTERPLPKLFGQLFILAEQQLSSGRSPMVAVFDNHHFLSVNRVAVAEHELAMVARFIIGAAPNFLAPRVQGHCYAIAVQYIASGQSFVCYSAFDITPHLRALSVKSALQSLAQDLPFIEQTLGLAKAKLGGSLLTSVSATAVAKFIASLG